MQQAVCIMGNAGYLPLAHCYDHGNPNYIFRARGIEETRLPENRAYSHKLFFKPATVMPHLPSGPALFGSAGTRFDGTLAPDAVVFIMLEKRYWHTLLGPRLYFLDELEVLLGRSNVANLRGDDFYIAPDQSVASKNVFGSVDGVSLFGVLKGMIRYMRFDYVRIEPALSTSRRDVARNAIARLKGVLDRKHGNAVWHADMKRGDILVVNNWRAASAWDEKYLHKYLSERILGQRWAAPSEEDVSPGDRVVFQMNFYLPDEMPLPAGAAENGADCREVDVKGQIVVHKIQRAPGDASEKVEIEGRVKLCEPPEE